MQFEYKSVKCTKKTFFSSSVDLKEFDAMLNQQADFGWGLVAVNTFGLGVSSGLIATFKREKQPANISKVA